MEVRFRLLDDKNDSSMECPRVGIGEGHCENLLLAGPHLVQSTGFAGLGSLQPECLKEVHRVVGLEVHLQAVGHSPDEIFELGLEAGDEFSKLRNLAEFCLYPLEQPLEFIPYG